jgi:aldose 1-epimerase
MRGMIEERTVVGIRALALATDETGGLDVTFIPSADMVGCSLCHRGDELLGQRGGLRTYIEERSTMGIPLLHPWANRLARTHFEVTGGEVDLDHAMAVTRDPNGLPMHGLLAAAVGWQVDRFEAMEDGGVLAASFDFARHPELMAAFPFPHRVQFEAALRGPTLTITTVVVASGDAPVPISFRYHPYLRLPGLDRSEWEVEMPVRERLELDDHMLPTGKRSPVQVEAGPLGLRTFDDAYLAPDPETPFTLTGGGRQIALAFGSGYRFAQVFAPLDDDVVAYEPMTAPTNALVTGGPDLPLLEPGLRYEATFSITVADRDQQPSRG